MRRKRGRTQTEWRQGRGFAVGAPARRSRDGNGKTSAPVGPMTGQPGFAAGEMRPNGSKGRGFAVGAPARRSRDGNGKTAVRGGEAMAAKRTTAQGGFAQRNAARDFARQTQKAGPMTGQPGFAAGEMRPNGSKGRGFAVGAPARRSRDGNGKTSAPVGPMTGQPGFAAGEMRPNGSKGRGGNGSRVWEKRKASAFAGPITKSADGVTFLMLRK